MKQVSYKEAEQLSFEWTQKKSIQLIVFTDSQCENCHFFDNVIVPEINKHGIDIYSVDLRTNQVPFPPSITPTLYWYFNEDMPPMCKKGTPPTKEILEDFLNKVKNVYNGESSVEKEFF
jgi:hypothetical protein